MARRIKLILEYDGTDFKGWQIQSAAEPGEQPETDARTVQGEFERALKQLTGQSIRCAAASRTDTGVHALGQVVTFVLPDDVAIATGELCMALNMKLPHDTAATHAEEVSLDFHPHRDSSGKIYSYAIVNRRCRLAVLRHNHWHVRFELNTELMRQAARALIGRHDFTSFATKLRLTQAQRAEEGKAALETVREIRNIEIIDDPLIAGRIVIRIEGSGFLYQMVRTIVGSLVDVGRGFRPPEWMAAALAARDRRQAGPTAPPHGLCLERVFY